MLKDIFKQKEEKIDKEKILSSIADGYVDIKAYKHSEDGKKTLVYHDTGDNTVTNWMRQAIMLLLSGYSLSKNGSVASTVQTSTRQSSACFSKPSNIEGAHSNQYNFDGYCLNGEQFLTDEFKNKFDSELFYPVSPTDSLYSVGDVNENYFALFPTKILLGTGCEYTDWDSLKEANEEDNTTWYSNIVQAYGDGNEVEAKKSFNRLVGQTDDVNDEEVRRYSCNSYSATIGAQGKYTSNGGSMLPAVTVNDPDTTSNISTTADMANRFGVVGAIKTLYLPSQFDSDSSNGNDLSSNYLETTVSDSGRLIKGKYRGAGRPCFIYFSRNKLNTATDTRLDWESQTSDVYVSKDNNSPYLNRITFKVVIPAQSSGTGAVGEYNPFNGYTFKQVGLFNDAVFSNSTLAEVSDQSKNMPCGTMLAVKNIQNFTKTADESIEFTWTLTI